MKFGLIPETDNTNSTTLKKLYDDIIQEIMTSSSFFQFSGQFGAIRKPETERRVCETYIFINSKKPKTELKNL